jgi:hypothetical protein
MIVADTSSGARVVPRYRELLERTDAPPGSSWTIFGDDDQLGTLNFIGPEEMRRAAGLVQEGRVFSLDYPVNTFVPSLAGTRPPTSHHIFANNPNHRDDWLDSFYLQSTSQLDGLRHIRHPQHGFYGGVADELISEGTPALGIQLVADRGIVTRGVLLDLPRYFASVGRPYDPSAGERIGVDELAGACAFHGVTLHTGDALLLRTGWAGDYLSAPADAQQERRDNWRCPGIEQSHAVLEFLWDNGISVLAADNGGVEMFPIDRDTPFYDPAEAAPERGPSHNGLLHRPLIALLGLHLGELWNLDPLADACADDGRYEFLLSAKPLAVTGGVGSPPNALAVK